LERDESHRELALGTRKANAVDKLQRELISGCDRQSPIDSGANSLIAWTSVACQVSMLRIS
jgi:hypothetical protein